MVLPGRPSKFPYFHPEKLNCGISMRFNNKELGNDGIED